MIPSNTDTFQEKEWKRHRYHFWCGLALVVIVLLSWAGCEVESSLN